jgi:hypothetical protein
VEERTIRELLDSRHERYVDLAVATEWSHTHLERVARGRLPLSRKLRRTLAVHFGVPEESIVAGRPPKAFAS